MTKIVTFLGFLVALSLGSIAFIGGSDVMAREDISVHATACAQGGVDLDEGYGVTRHVQPDCAQR